MKSIPPIERACQKCGTRFFTYASEIKKGGGKFCSRKCSGNPPVERACANCGNTFSLYPSDLKRGRKYCGKACQGKAKTHNAQVEHTCQHCGKAFPRIKALTRVKEARFCSNDCYHASTLIDPITYFWEHVDKNGPVPEHCPELGPCWVWTGPQNVTGYGRIFIVDKYVAVHRFSYKLHKGPLGPNMNACHACDNRICIRPEHLFEGTSQDNAADRDRKGRQARGVRSNSAKLNDDLVRQIRDLHSQGMPYTQIAKLLNVTVGSVGKAGRGLTWKHVT